MRILECPVCGTDTNSQGKHFSDVRALSLHVAGSARKWNDYEHRSWVKELLPNNNVNSYTVNDIDSHIRGHVWQALKEAEPEELNLDEEEGEVEEGENKESFLRAYARFWEIETRLHHFISECLAPESNDELWRAFPDKLQHECLARAQQDDSNLPLDRYIDFLDLREVIKHTKNKDHFRGAFDSLSTEFSDPQSEFHSKLVQVNRIRNNLMHPLKRLAPSDEDIDTLEQFLEFVQKFTSSNSS